MKIKTNLSYSDLHRVAKGLEKLSKAKTSEAVYIPENDVERALLKEADSVFDTFLESLSKSFEKVLKE